MAPGKLETVKVSGTEQEPQGSSLCNKHMRMVQTNKTLPK